MQTDVVIREPNAAEIPRAVHLFRNSRLPPETRLLVAVKMRPIERFVAVAAWWPEGAFARFQLASQPGANRAEIGGPLLERLTDAARSAGLTHLENAGLLSDCHEWLEVLKNAGFKLIRSERSFEIAYRDAWNRVMKLREKHSHRIPPSWRTDPIRQHAPETILELIAPHRLMPPAEVCDYWRAGLASGFDPDLSCVLFDGDRPFGAFLLRRSGDLLYIDVQVVREPNPRLRSLGDLCVLYHPAQRLAPGGEIQRIQFRSGETEHRQTANLALRMGGREISRGHVLGKKLAA